MRTAVLVEFESAKIAEVFVKKVNGSYNALEPTQGKSIKVTGVWKIPSVFCECEGSGKMKMRAYGRSVKYGWWVHSVCRKPSKYWGQAAPRLWQALGRNVLPGVDDDGEPHAYPGHAQEHDNTMLSELNEVSGNRFELDRRIRREKPERPRKQQ